MTREQGHDLMGEPERAGEGAGREEPEFCDGQVELGMRVGHSGGAEVPGGATLGLETRLRHQGSQACGPGRAPRGAGPDSGPARTTLEGRSRQDGRWECPRSPRWQWPEMGRDHLSETSRGGPGPR